MRKKWGGQNPKFSPISHFRVLKNPIKIFFRKNEKLRFSAKFPLKSEKFQIFPYKIFIFLKYTVFSRKKNSWRNIWEFLYPKKKSLKTPYKFFLIGQKPLRVKNFLSFLEVLAGHRFLKFCVKFCKTAKNKWFFMFFKNFFPMKF